MQIKELGHVVLYVTDVTRMANFYRDTLGFREIVRDDGIAAFSSGRTHHELLLIGVGGKARLAGRIDPGLYHIGFKVADTHEELRTVYKELQQKKVPIVGTGDHGITHSIYVTDPDGNELELYADVSDEWKKNPRAIMQPVKTLDLE